MAYRFDLEESAEMGFRRIAGAQVSKALKKLRNDRGQEATVHECRKALKRLRALLKLVRSGLGKAAYRAEYDNVRDIGRSLSGVRDLEVMPHALAYLRATSDPRIAEAETQILDAIRQAHADTVEPGNRDELLSVAINALVETQARYQDTRLREGSFELLAKGAASSLRRLRRDHRIATATSDAEAYHDWRKSAQLHWRHLKLLMEIWPELLSARIRVVKALADVLGLDHDLEILSDFVKTIPTSLLSRARSQAVLKNVLEQQLLLRSQARAYADLLIVDEPTDFAQKLTTYNEARRRILRLDNPLCDLRSVASDH